MESPLASFPLRLSCLAVVLTLALACTGSSADVSPIDQQAIRKHLEKISANPHPPGSPAQVQVGDYLVSELKSFGAEPQLDEFEPITPMGRLKMRNIWGIIPGKTDRIIILASHYDSKYFKDFRFVGANDPGSSAALVLELARLLAKNNPTDFTIWCTFFDGEEAIDEWTDLDSLYGSRRFVQMLESRNQLGKLAGLFLFDLIGDSRLTLRRDGNSTPSLNDIIWTTGQEMGFGSIFVQGGTVVVDDHIPFARAGVPVVDLIDLDYPEWHTAADTVDKVSIENVATVGTVFLAALPKLAKALGSPPARRTTRPVRRVR